MPCVHVHLATSFPSRGSPSVSLPHSLSSLCIPVGAFVDLPQFLSPQQQGGGGGELQRAAVHSAGISSRKLNVCWPRETPGVSLWRDGTRASQGLWRPSGVHMASCETEGRFFPPRDRLCPPFLHFASPGSSSLSDVPLHKRSYILSHPLWFGI